MATRFLLGSFEASVAPIFIAIVTQVSKPLTTMRVSPNFDVSGTVVQNRRTATQHGTVCWAWSTS